MLLLFASADYPPDSLRLLCRQLRHQGYLVCLPEKKLTMEQLSTVPFTAALLCFRKQADGLPSPEMLRQHFSGLRLLVLSDKNPSSRWRSIPDTDDELGVPHEFSEICAMLDKAGVFCDATRETIHRYGIELPADRKSVLLGVRRTALSPAQYTILRLLLLCENPLTDKQIAGFLRSPRGNLLTGSVRVHIHDLNQIAADGSIPRLIRYVYRTGYRLCSPYGDYLPKQ